MSPASATARKPKTDPIACFSVFADAEPGVMPRVLEQFAKRGLVPTVWYSRVIGRELSIDLQMRGMDGAAATQLAACLRQIAAVETVVISERRGAAG